MSLGCDLVFALLPLHDVQEPAPVTKGARSSLKFVADAFVLFLPLVLRDRLLAVRPSAHVASAALAVDEGIADICSSAPRLITVPSLGVFPVFWILL